jgi:uncharacterized protein YacL
MKALARNVIMLAMPAALIVWAYSPNTYFRYFDFPFSVTLMSYVVIYVLVLAVSVVLAPLVARRVSRSSMVRAILQAIVATLVFAILAVVFGTTGFNVADTRFNGIFFAEWKFFRFFFYVGLPVAITAAATSLLEDDNDPQSQELR